MTMIKIRWEPQFNHLLQFVQSLYIVYKLITTIF